MSYCTERDERGQHLCGYGDGACPWHPYSLALNGLPPDVAATAWETLMRLGARSEVYRLPLLTSGFFANLTAGTVDLLFKFPAVGVIFGLGQNVVLGAAAEVLDLTLAIQDSSSNRNLIGTVLTPFSLTGVPDAQKGGLDQLRLTPMSCAPETDWSGKVGVVSGSIAATKGVINLLGVSFWIGGRNLTSRQGSGAGLGASPQISGYSQ